MYTTLRTMSLAVDGERGVRINDHIPDHAMGHRVEKPTSFMDIGGNTISMVSGYP
jgi:hypothetical protein